MARKHLAVEFFLNFMGTLPVKIENIATTSIFNNENVLNEPEYARLRFETSSLVRNVS